MNGENPTAKEVVLRELNKTLAHLNTLYDLVGTAYTDRVVKLSEDTVKLIHEIAR